MPVRNIRASGRFLSNSQHRAGNAPERKFTVHQTEEGIKWIDGQVHSIAHELKVQLDGPPEWDDHDLFNFKMAVEVAGQRKILKLWRPHIDDSQGGNDPATQGIRQKLQDQMREFLRSFVQPKKRIGF